MVAGAGVKVGAGVKTSTTDRLDADRISPRPKMSGRKNTKEESMGQGMMSFTYNVLALLLSAGPLGTITGVEAEKSL